MEDDGHQIGYEVLPKGTPVVASDGVEVGHVAKVLDNEREHIFDGIVVKGGGRTVFVDAPEVGRITRRRVTLTITGAAVEALPEHQGWMGALERRAQRRVSRLKRRFGR